MSGSDGCVGGARVIVSVSVSEHAPLSVTSSGGPLHGTRVLDSCCHSYDAFLGLGHGRGRNTCLCLVQLGNCCRTGRFKGGLDLGNVVDDGHRARYQTYDILSGGFPVQLLA